MLRKDKDGFIIPATPEKIKARRKRESAEGQELQPPQTPCTNKSAKLDEVSPNSRMILSVLDDLKDPIEHSQSAAKPHVFNPARQLSVRQLTSQHQFVMYCSRPKMLAVVKIGNGPFAVAKFEAEQRLTKK